jgi:predicted GH43/DUF377 family glycosyl hydrolase
MLRRLFTKLLVRPEDLTPMREDMEVISTFNPGVIEAGNEVVLLVRVAERPKEKREGYTAIPRFDPYEGLAIDWFPNSDLDRTDPRVVVHLPTGVRYLTFVSHILVMRSADGRSIDRIDGTAFKPEMGYEAYGVEDPRITRLDNRYYITYVAVSSHGACTALASTTDFQTYERHGIIFPAENKDVVLFPEKIEGEYWALHRPNPNTHFSPPEMWTARSLDLVRWGQNLPFYGGTLAWEGGRVGAGAPPFRVQEGWLEIYHGNRRPSPENRIGAYAGGAMLLDPVNPNRIIRQTGEAILLPQEEFEQEGFVSHVVFPTGVVDRGETLLVYYGASDTYTAVVEFDRNELLACLG